jgi:putative membrane protein
LRRPLDYIILYLKGICIGASGVLQGVSGGSLSLLLGIYQEFVYSIRAFDRKAFELLRGKKIYRFWKKVNGNFLSTLLAGIVTGFFTLRPLVSALYSEHFVLVSSFFFSLIIIAALLLFRKITRWNPTVLIFIVIGFCISYLLTRAPHFETSDNVLTDFIAGALACSTLIVPGVSGSFILLFIGKYQYILASFGSPEIAVMVFFMAGGILGVWAAARYIGNMMADGFNPTVALLGGLMMGSLNKIWPWRVVYEYATTLQGKQIPGFDKSILPWRYTEFTGKDPQIFYAVLMMALGVFMMVLIEKVAARLKTRS